MYHTLSSVGEKHLKVAQTKTFTHIVSVSLQAFKWLLLLTRWGSMVNFATFKGDLHGNSNLGQFIALSAIVLQEVLS